MTAGHSRNSVQSPVALMITPLERAALQLLAVGHGRREIATHLGLAEPDATLQLLRLFARMGVSSDRDAIAAASRRGLLQIHGADHKEPRTDRPGARTASGRTPRSSLNPPTSFTIQPSV
jgi:DNA-binding CsgD family transcriptional regulator